MTRDVSIAVTGATGELGGRVAARLAQRGVAQRLIVRDPNRAPQLPGAEPALASSYSDTEGMRSALADVEIVALTSDGHEGKTYDVTGREALPLSETAWVLSEVTGRTITYHDETMEEAWESRAQYGAPRFEVEGWITSYVAIATGEMG